MYMALQGGRAPDTRRSSRRVSTVSLRTHCITPITSFLASSCRLILVVANLMWHNLLWHSFAWLQILDVTSRAGM